VPSVEDVAERLRWVADHRDRARAMGRAASAWAHAERNIWDKGPAVLDLIEAFSYPARTLRRVPTFWVPSWGAGGEIAAYTRRLRRALPRSRATARAPRPRRHDLVHVQHGPELFDGLSSRGFASPESDAPSLDDADLVRQIVDAHRSGAAVAVTEHRVEAQGHPWEPLVDALVATTARGAEQLRARVPEGRVAHIPLGCPEPLPGPVRAARSGPVLGALGALRRGKGFWALLDVLRALPGAELLLFSRAPDERWSAEWRAASAGLPVRWVDDELPERQVVQRLAAEAEVLVFWYEARPWHAASAAVRTGLATGVPVLASPTSWFEDLAEVTFQPEELVTGVQRLLGERALRVELAAAAKEYCHAHRWSRIAEMHVALWRTLTRAIP
jgi:glycosyltransferase involved in cell wall biosynthesis